MAARREYHFTFDDEARALLFVRRLCLTLSDLAIFRAGCVVRVLDGSYDGQGAEIVRLAKVSGGFPTAARITEP